MKGQSSLLSAVFNKGRKKLSEAHVEHADKETYSLLSHVLKCDISWIISRMNDHQLNTEQVQYFQQLLTQRCKRIPLAYLLGEKEFYGRTFKVGPGVLCPRPETEHLVECVLEQHRRQPLTRGLDLCCGSGNIGISLHLEGQLPFKLVDVSNSALKWAAVNLQNFELNPADVSLHTCDVLHDNLSSFGTFDLITINPPYISREETLTLAPEVIRHEPDLALFGGEKSGLEFFGRLLPRLGSVALPGCLLFVELGANHEKLLKSNHSYHGWTLKTWKKDLAGHDRISVWIYQN